MNKKDYGLLASLALLAVFIWFRDTGWMSSSDDTLPILVALPVFFWLGHPWNINPEGSFTISTKRIILIILLFLVGIVAESTLLLALGWTLLLWTWLSQRIPPERYSSLQKLMILPIMSFPWVTLDMQQLGWWFRLSGAWVTANLYALAGFDVIYSGTNLLIDQTPISVEAACSGLNTLQSMLIAGSVVAYILLGETNRYWWNLPVLIVMAWIANTVRVVVISGAALTYGRDFALGAFHTWGGWFILVLMFASCWFIFQLQEPKPVNDQRRP